MLNQMKCTVCKEGDIPLNDREIAEYLTQVPGWSSITENNIPKIERIFLFKDYTEALAFTNQVADLAEQEGHHPSIRLDWGKVTVTWWTHKIKGLHQNDFIMAAKTNDLFQKK